MSSNKYFQEIGIQIIEESENSVEAKSKLIENFFLSDKQANSVLDMPSMSRRDILKYQTILEILCGREGQWSDFLWWMYETFPVTLKLRRRLKFLGEPVRYLKTYGFFGSFGRLAFKFKRRFRNRKDQKDVETSQPYSFSRPGK